MATRHERVVLALEDQFSPGMAKATASTVLFKKSLNDLDGTSTRVDRALKETTKSGSAAGREFDRSSKSIDQFSGRLGLAARALASVGPAAIPIAAVAVPALTALAGAMGAAALAGGTAVLAFQGVGDALTALNNAQLDPTAANLEKARQAFDDISPSARQFVLDLDQAGPALAQLKAAAGADMFPGLSVALNGALTQLPEVRDLFQAVGGAVGDLGTMTGESLASGKWGGFLEMLETEAPKAIVGLGTSVGSLTHGLAELWMAFTPLNDRLLGGLVDAAATFDVWSSSLSSTDGFKEFLDFLAETGPQVGATLGAIGDAVLQVVEAIAPLGGPSLKIIETFANAIATIADSPIGTPLLGIVSTLATLSLLNKALDATRAGFARIGPASEEAAAGTSKFNSTAGRLASAAGKAALPIAGIALSATDLDEQLGVSNTAMLTLMGTMGGPWGAAAGFAVGGFLDMQAEAKATAKTYDDLKKRIDALAAGVGSQAGLGDDLGSQRAALEAAKRKVDGGPLEGEFDKQLATLDKLDAQYADVVKSTDVTSMSTDQLAQSMSQSASAALREAGGIEGVISAMKEKRSATLSALNAELGYKGAILDANDALKENGKNMDESTRGGLANKAALANLADAWNGQSDAAKNAKGSLKEAKDNYVTTAVAMGMAEGKARKLASSIFEIPTKRAIQIELRDNARERAAAIKAELQSIKDEEVYINIKARRPNMSGFGAQIGASAEGSTVPHGGDYVDKHLYMLAPGEEVISNRHGQADRHRSLLKAINNDRMGPRSAYELASGGRVVRRGPKRVSA